MKFLGPLHSRGNRLRGGVNILRAFFGRGGVGLIPAATLGKGAGKGAGIFLKYSGYSSFHRNICSMIRNPLVSFVM